MIKCPPLNPPNVAHNFTRHVDECPDYRVNFVQFRYCWDWGTSPLYGLSWVLIVYKHNVNAFGTEQSVCNIVDDRFSGVFVRWVPLYM